jgi:hypothetical protein
LEGTKKSSDRCNNFKKLFKWYGILRDLDDEDLKIICGTDYALFLIFERYAAYFFSTVSIINLFIFIPIYLTGNRDDRSMYINDSTTKVLIKYISALAIMGDSDRDKRLALFILMMTLFSTLTFGLMYYYWKKSYHWRHK